MKDVSYLGDYIGNFMCFYYDYNQIEEGYRMLRETIMNYDKDNSNTSGIRTEYMYDLGEVHFKNQVFLMNFDNILTHIKLNFEDKFISGNVENYNGNIEFIKRDLEKYLLKKKTVIICCDSDNTRKRIVKYIDDIDLFETNESNIFEGKINIIVKNIDNGFIYDNYVILSVNDLFRNTEVKKKYKNKFKLGTKVGSVSNISKGDYIVHESHGIGIYDELTTIVKNGYKKDYIKLVYDGGDVLYIPVEKIDRISKFSGKEGVSVKLDSLSNDKWQRKKGQNILYITGLSGSGKSTLGEELSKSHDAFYIELDRIFHETDVDAKWNPDGYQKNVTRIFMKMHKELDITSNRDINNRQRQQYRIKAFEWLLNYCNERP